MTMIYQEEGFTAFHTETLNELNIAVSNEFAYASVDLDTAKLSVFFEANGSGTISDGKQSVVLRGEAFKAVCEYYGLS